MLIFSYKKKVDWFYYTFKRLTFLNLSKRHLKPLINFKLTQVTTGNHLKK